MLNLNFSFWGSINILCVTSCNLNIAFLYFKSIYSSVQKSRRGHCLFKLWRLHPGKDNGLFRNYPLEYTELVTTNTFCKKIIHIYPWWEPDAGGVILSKSDSMSECFSAQRDPRGSIFLFHSPSSPTPQFDRYWVSEKLNNSHRDVELICGWLEFRCFNLCCFQYCRISPTA